MFVSGLVGVSEARLLLRKELPWLGWQGTWSGEGGDSSEAPVISCLTALYCGLGQVSRFLLASVGSWRVT